MAHVAVLRLSVVNLVSVVVVAVLRVSLVALRTGPVPLTQGRHHPLLAWDVVGLHEGHAGQHRLTAQQPGPFHMVSNRAVGMVCHRRGLNACVFGGEQRGLHSR